MATRGNSDRGSKWGACHVGELVLGEIQQQGTLQREVAERMGITPQGLGKLLRRADWRIDYIFRACRALNFDFFLAISGQVAPPDGERAAAEAAALEEKKALAAQIEILKRALEQQRQKDAKEIIALRGEVSAAKAEMVRLNHEVEKQLAVAEALKVVTGRV